MAKKKLIILLFCLLIVAGGITIYGNLTKKDSDQPNPGQVLTGGTEFTFSNNWSVSYDATSQQVTVTGSIANNTGAAHQIDILVVLRDQSTNRVITTFTEAFPLPATSGDIRFSFTHDCPTPFTQAYPEFTVSAAY